MKTKEEIQEAIEQLKANKLKTPRYNSFGDDKHEAIDAMIKVLQLDFDTEMVESVYGMNEDEQYNYDAACGILEWRDGDCPLDELLY